jgi:ectoine hydroxylase-related dioxygenase (phytanoyl-CoA dioxygenase family)
LKIKDIDEALYNLKEEGYCHFKSIIKQNYIEDFRKNFFFLFNKISGYNLPENFNNEDLPEILKVFRKKSPKKLNSFFKTCKLTNSFKNLFFNREIQELSSKILGINKETVIISENQLRIDEPRDNLYVLDWHQDSPFYPQTKNGADSIVLNIFVQNCYQNMGSVELIKESHKQGMLSFSEDYASSNVQQMKVEKKYLKSSNCITVETMECDVVVYDMNLIHRSGFNSSNKARLSIIGRAFNPLSESFIPYQYKSIELIK